MDGESVPKSLIRRITKTDLEAVASILAAVRCRACGEPLDYLPSGVWACPRMHASWTVENVQEAVIPGLLAENRRRSKVQGKRIFSLASVVAASRDGVKPAGAVRQEPARSTGHGIANRYEPWMLCEQSFCAAIDVPDPQTLPLADEIKLAYVRTHTTADGRQRFKDDVWRWLRKPGRLGAMVGSWPFAALSRMQQIAEDIDARREFLGSVDLATMYLSERED